jgi:hypothetical protein
MALYCVLDGSEQVKRLGLVGHIAALSKNGQRLRENLLGFPVEGHACHALGNVHPDSRHPTVVAEVREKAQAILELDPR